MCYHTKWIEFHYIHSISQLQHMPSHSSVFQSFHSSSSPLPQPPPPPSSPLYSRTIFAWNAFNRTMIITNKNAVLFRNAFNWFNVSYDFVCSHHHITILKTPDAIAIYIKCINETDIEILEHRFEEWNTWMLS